MKLKFTGKDGSMGFKNGCIYDVRLYSSRQFIWIQCGSVCCPYESLASLLSNWSELRKGE